MRSPPDAAYPLLRPSRHKENCVFCHRCCRAPVLGVANDTVVPSEFTQVKSSDPPPVPNACLHRYLGRCESQSVLGAIIQLMALVSLAEASLRRRLVSRLRDASNGFSANDSQVAAVLFVTVLKYRRRCACGCKVIPVGGSFFENPRGGGRLIGEAAVPMLIPCKRQDDEYQRLHVVKFHRLVYL